MRVPDVEGVLQSLRDVGDARYGSGAGQHEVAEVERSLGLILPAGYRAFVLQVGWAEVGGIAVFGLGEGVPADLDLRAVVAGARPGLPPSAVPFARDSSGAIFCLDAAHSGPYESPAYRWHPEAPAEEALEYAGHDFASWLWMQLAEHA